MQRSVLVFFAFLVSLLHAQPNSQPTVDARHTPLQWIGRDVSPDSLVSVIVEFRELPLLIMKRNPSSAPLPDYSGRVAQFVSDLTTAAPGPRSAQLTIRRHFFHAYHGISAVMTAAATSAAASLPYVKAVHPNRVMTASLHKSLPQIRANEAWGSYAVKGDGVRVGIIDTGIDYLHDALGGGFGPSFRVKGGYDFVNGDEDPMDDNGHGTHVAGIVAADGGGMSGVAPHAQLYAYKVLDAEGHGSEDDIVAAVERTADPNNDGDGSDHLDVVNLSLGSKNGKADDPSSIAVDNVSALGVTVVVAAGNEGYAEFNEAYPDNYFYSGLETIGSPGTSKSAITVGAVDSLDKMAYFSSKGPVPVSYAIKPEVTAPGMNIRSLAPGNGVAIHSGTSMATPMVAGVAALLKQADPSRTPEQIKSLIVNASADLGFTPMLQGAGRVDAMRALGAGTSVAPVVIDGGLDDPALLMWQRTVPVTVRNHRASSQSYSLAFTGGAAGVTVSAVPSAFTIPAGGVQTVNVSITVNNAQVPIVDENIILYNGMVWMRGSSDTVHLPWSFARTTRMVLTFSDPGARFIGSSATMYLTPRYNKIFSRTRWIDEKTAEITGVTRELYDFGVLFPATTELVLKNGLSFTGSNAFAFDRKDAVHTVHFDGTDEKGVPFGTATAVQRSMLVDMPTGLMFVPLSPGQKSFNVSPAGPVFHFTPVEALIDPAGTGRVVIPQYATFSGVSGDIHLATVGTPYLHQTVRFRLPTGAGSTRLYSEIISAVASGGDNFFNTAIVGQDTLSAVNGWTEFDLFLMAPASLAHFSSVGFYTNSSYAQDTRLDVATRYLTIVNDSVMLGLPSQRMLTTYISPNHGVLSFGDAPVSVFNLSYNNSFGPSIHFDPMFMGATSESRYSAVSGGTYSIRSADGVVVKEGALDDYPRPPFMTDPAKYSLLIRSAEYPVSHGKGRTTLRTDVDLTRTVADAPAITTFRILNAQQRAVSSVMKNEQARLQFSSRVMAYPLQTVVPESTMVRWRRTGSTVWNELPVQSVGGGADKEGLVFSGLLTPATTVDSSAVDLSVRVVDQSGNAAEMIIAPAFTVGEWNGTGVTDVEEQQPAVLSRFVLGQNYPNPFNPTTTIRFSLPVAGPVTLTVYDAIGREVALILREFLTAGTHTVKIDASRWSGGVYFYRLASKDGNAVRKMVLLK